MAGGGAWICGDVFLVVRLCGREAWCCGLSLAGIF